MSTMSGMASSDPMDGLWNWCASATIDAAIVRDALAGVLGCLVTTLDVPAPGAVLCDVWQVGGDFPTLIDCYVTPGDLDEPTVAAAVATRLGAALLLPDDTLNPTRYLRVEPHGASHAVHVDELETDEGPERRHARPCTGADPACAAGPGCSRSRWKPSSAPPQPEAA